MISKQSKLDNEESYSHVNNAFKKLNKISNCDGDFTSLIIDEKIGKKQVSHYKKLNLEIKKPTKDHSDEILCDINTEKYYKIFKLINEKPKPEEKTSQITGIVKVVDLEKHSFKIESTYGDETKIIRCDFDKKYEEFMVENFNKEISIELKKFTEKFIDKNLNKSYELVNILN